MWPQCSCQHYSAKHTLQMLCLLPDPNMQFCVCANIRQMIFTLTKLACRQRSCNWEHTAPRVQLQQLWPIPACNFSPEENCGSADATNLEPPVGLLQQASASIQSDNMCQHGTSVASHATRHDMHNIVRPAVALIGPGSNL